MGAVDAELMCAACDGVEEDLCCAVLVYTKDFVFGESLFSLDQVHLLTGAFVVVRSKRKAL